MEIVESYLQSKSGKSDGGEDRLVLGPRFFGVVDGATDKSGLNWGTQETPRAGGYVLASIIKAVLEENDSVYRNYEEILPEHQHILQLKKLGHGGVQVFERVEGVHQ